MKRNREGSKPIPPIAPFWTHAQANTALPYIASIMRTLRETRLEIRRHQVRAVRLAAQPGRPSRAALIAQQEALREAQRAEGRFQEALQELQDLGVYCQDPVNGQALLPFVHDHLLAWIIYDGFDPQPLRFWRFQSDTEDLRRPIEEIIYLPASKQAKR